MNGSVRLWKLCVQELIGYLDAIDADPDLEPVLGYVVRGLPDEGEIDHDAEPSLGWTGTINQAARQFHGGTDDREDEHYGREPDADNEPSLCGVGMGYLRGDRDLEQDDADREPALGAFENMMDQSKSWRQREG